MLNYPIAVPVADNKPTTNNKKPESLLNRGFQVFAHWRRRRDSNSRNPFGVYTISSRAPSTRLGDFSVFL